MSSKQLNYRIHLYKEVDGRYTVIVPALPGCITFGDNVDNAIENAKEAIEVYTDELRSQGEEIPDDSETLEYSVSLPA